MADQDKTAQLAWEQWAKANDWPDTPEIRHVRLGFMSGWTWHGMIDASPPVTWPLDADGEPPSSHLVEQALVSPMDWDSGGRTHNWRNHIHELLRALWETFTPQQKVALAMNADFEAGMEEWD